MKSYLVFTVDLETCPSEDTYCVMVSKRKSVVDEGFSLVSENYSCDINNLCEEKGLTDSLGKSCKMFKVGKLDCLTHGATCGRYRQIFIMSFNFMKDDSIPG